MDRRRCRALNTQWNDIFFIAYRFIAYPAYSFIAHWRLARDRESLGRLPSLPWLNSFGPAQQIAAAQELPPSNSQFPKATAPARRVGLVMVVLGSWELEL
jgi:hypothetical protein